MASGQGQDAWLAEYFKHQSFGIAIDIGANDGLFYSNTKALEDSGWVVVCIEPNYRCWESLMNNRKLVLPYAVGDYNGIGKLHIMDSPNGVNASGTALKPIHGLPVIETSTVIVKTLNTILDELFNLGKIDLLTIDVEGGEVAILNGFDIDIYRPQVVIVEGNDREEIAKYMDKHGYKHELDISLDMVFTYVK